MNKSRYLLVSLLLITGCGGEKTSTTSNNPVSNETSKIVSSDVVAPTIHGVRNQNYSKGESLSVALIKKGVYGIDDVDGRIDNVSLEIQDYYTKTKTNNIDPNADGRYILVFTCKDSAGNSASATSVMRIGNPEMHKNNDGSEKTKWGSGYEYDYDAVQKDYKLVFEDDFKTNGEIDREAWEFHIGTGSNGWGNGEKQYYTDRIENVSCFAGNLKIQARKEKYSVNNYTSGRVRTKESFLYGKFEVKAYIPSGGKGTWPAIWLLPQDPKGTYGVWPASGEIDLMETSGNFFKSSVVQTLHRKSLAGSTAAASQTTYIPDFYSGYHTYTLEWLPNLITMSIDGELRVSYSVENAPSRQNSENWPYDIDYYLIMNYAIGSWDGMGMGGPIDDTIFETEDTSMYIDYVRIYQSDIVTNLYPTK